MTLSTRIRITASRCSHLHTSPPSEGGLLTRHRKRFSSLRAFVQTADSRTMSTSQRECALSFTLPLPRTNSETLTGKVTEPPAAPCCGLATVPKATTRGLLKSGRCPGEYRNAERTYIRHPPELEFLPLALLFNMCSRQSGFSTLRRVLSTSQHIRRAEQTE